MRSNSHEDAPKLTFNDGLIRVHTKTPDSRSVVAFSFNYSPAFGKIIQFEPLGRYKHLVDLSLVGHKFSDIRTLSNLVLLKKLNLSWNAITDIRPLASLVSLEVLNLSHNKITTIPVAFENLMELHTLNLSSNRIVNENELTHLQENKELRNVDFEGNPFMIDENSFHFVIFTLPQVTTLNRKKIARDSRVQSTQKFSVARAFQSSSFDTFDRPEETKSEVTDLGTSGTAFQIYLEEAQNRRNQSLRQVEETQAENQHLRRQLNDMKIGLAFAKTVAERKPEPVDEEASHKIKKLKRKLFEARKQDQKLNESLALEKAVNVKQRQMFNRLKERYEAERRSKEPVGVHARTPTPPIKKSAEIRLEMVRDENKKLLAKIRQLETDAECHTSEIESQRKQIKELKSAQSQIEVLRSDYKSEVEEQFKQQMSEQEKTFELERKKYESELDTLRQTCKTRDAEISKQKQQIMDLQRDIDDNKAVQSELASSLERMSKEDNELKEEQTLKINEMESVIKQRGSVIQGLRSELHKKDLVLEEMKGKQRDLETTLESYQSKLNELSTNQSSLLIESYEGQMASTKATMESLSQEKRTIERDYVKLQRVHEAQTKQFLELKKQLKVLHDKLRESHNTNELLTQENNKSKELVQAASDALSVKERQITQLKSEREGLIAQMSSEIRARDARIQGLEQNLESTAFSSRPAFGNRFEDESSVDLGRSCSEFSVDRFQRQLLKYQNELRAQKSKVNNQEETVANMRNALMSAQETIEELKEEIENKKELVVDQVRLNQELSARYSEQEAEVQQVVSHLNHKIASLKEKLAQQKAQEATNSATVESLRASEAKTETIVTQLKRQLLKKDTIINDLRTSSRLVDQTCVNEQLRETKAQLLSVMDLNSRILMEVENLALEMSVKIESPMSTLDNDNFQQFQNLLDRIKSEYGNVKKELKSATAKYDEERARCSLSLAKMTEAIQKKDQQISVLREQLRSLSDRIQQQDNQIVQLQAQERDLLMKETITKEKDDMSLKLSQLEHSSDESFGADQKESARLRDELEQTKSHYEQTIHKLTDRKKALKKEREMMSTEIETLNQTVQTKSAELDRLSTKLQLLESYRSDVISSIEAIEQKSQMKEISLKKELAETESLLKAAKEREETFISQIESQNAANTELTAKVKDLKKKLAAARVDANELQLRMNESKQMHATLLAERENELSKCVEAIDSLREQLLATTDEYQTNKNSLATEKQEVEFELMRSQDTIDRMSKKVTKLSKRLEEEVDVGNQSHTANLDLKKENKRLRNELNEAKRQVQHITDVNAMTEHVFKSLSVKYQELQSQYHELEKSLSTEVLAGQRLELSNRADQAERNNEKLSREIEKLKGKLETSELRRTEQACQMSQLQDEISTLKEQKRKLDTDLTQYMDKFNESQKTIQILQTQFRESTQVSRDLSSQIVETKESMIDRREYEAVLQRLETSRAKRQDLKRQLLQTQKQGTKDAATIQEQDTEIQQLNEKIETMEHEMTQQKEHFEEKIDHLKSKLSTTQNQAEDYQSQIHELSGNVANLEDTVRKREEAIVHMKQLHSVEVKGMQQRIEELTELSNLKDTTITEREQERRDIEEKWASTSTDLNSKMQLYDQKLAELAKKKEKMEAKHDDIIRELAQAKRQIRVLQEEKEQFEGFIAEKEIHIRQLAARLEGTVNRSVYEELLDKYNEAKHLKMFSEQKMHSSTFEFERQRESMEKTFKEKEESMSEDIRDLRRQIERQKSANAKLIGEVQLLNRRLKSYVDPNSEKVSREELRILEETHEKTEKEMKVIAEKNELLVSQNEDLRKELSQKVKEVIVSNEKEKVQTEQLERCRNDLATKSELLNRISAIATSLQGTLRSRDCTVAQCCAKINPLFGLFDMSEVAIRSLAEILSVQSETVFDTCPDGRHEKMMRMIRKCKSDLTSLPVKYDENLLKSNSYNLEVEIRTLGQMIIQAKNYLDDQADHMREMGALISRQHTALIKMKTPSPEDEEATEVYAPMGDDL